MEGRKIPYSEAVGLWKDLKPSDIIVLPSDREIDFGTLSATLSTLQQQTWDEIRSILAKGDELMAKTLAHKIQSEPSPDGGVAWSCSCGARGHSADRRDHWADVMIRDMNDRCGGSVPQLTPEAERESREQIFAAIDEYLLYRRH
jgi:hypothetical protein